MGIACSAPIVMPAQAGIQYAVRSRFSYERLCVLGSRFRGDDGPYRMRKRSYPLARSSRRITLLVAVIGNESVNAT